MFYIYGLLSALILVVAFVYFGGWAHLIGEYPVEHTVLIETRSADGAYAARLERKTNNHGWCEERTTVDSWSRLSDWGREYVFNIDCGSEVRMSWVNDRHLQIAYSYNEAGEVRAYKKFTSKDKQVRISYLFDQAE